MVTQRNDGHRSKADDVFERVHNANEALCVGEGDVRNRLVIAGEILSPLRPEDFPESLREDFCWIMQELTRWPGRHKREGRIEATMARIRRKTGRRIAEHIWKMFVEIPGLRGRPMYY